MNFLKKIALRLLWVIPSVCLVLMVLFSLFQKRQYENIIDELGGYEALEKGRSLEQEKIKAQLTKEGYYLPNWYWSVIPAHKSENKEASFFNSRPITQWNGFACKWHVYLKKIFRSKWTSSKDGASVWPKIWRAVSITFLINFIALFLIVIISIPLGKRLYQHESKGMITFLFGWSAIPLFWIATMVYIIGLSLLSKTFSGIPHLNPGELVSAITFLRLENIKYLIMPIVSIVFLGLAYLAIQTYRSIHAQDERRFMMAARSKALSANHVLLKHSMPNAMITIYTIIGNSLPGLISGSIVIEWIFNIPGMGRALWNAVVSADWQMILGIFIVSVIVSVLAQTLTDIYHHSKLKVGY